MSKYKEYAITLAIVVVGVLVALAIKQYVAKQKALSITSTDPSIRVANQ